MSLVSVVSIVPVGKQTPEHSVPLWLLASPTDGPPDFYAYHSWLPVAPDPKAQETIQARPDVWTKENVQKIPLQDSEKTGFDSFQQQLVAQGLQQAPPIDLSKLVDPKAPPADAQPADIKLP